MRKYIYPVIWWLLSLACMLVIFVYSSQNSTESVESSSRVTEIITKIFVRDYTSLSKSEQQEIISRFGPYVRGAAHAAEYAALGFCLFFAVSWHIDGKKTFIAPPVLCLAYALTDELHQLSSDGRAFQLTDIAKDFAGSVAGTCLAALIMLVIAKAGRVIPHNQ